MLTDERLKQLERMASDFTIPKLSLRNAVDELAHEVRTLQQQNAQMIEAFDKLDSIHDFGTPLEDGVSYSFVDVAEANEIHSEVKELFDRIKGGSANES